ncbi:hypothetical protein BCP78_0075 [Bacillus phage BCP78]|uniref:Uncharacterized protein n=3 Tax=Tsarbombavirus BCP78 TaxID=1985182 RepID=J9PRA8_9CAUD|nr:hypothetical protein BCP78_0075 [Bacillus phage BCP78]YP_009783438.1 hypothetical protein QLX27_gp065 [Bacillus phage BCU4]AEW47082.1 hypothetical protein BCP78_0075 [Bacillus phage BCP78]AEW47571.1 hypothetical protein BCU4_0065 [Bacillus phage BCU4]AQN32449.1 hypothetical protein BCP12_026 [Bacillus phage BCP12]
MEFKDVIFYMQNGGKLTVGKDLIEYIKFDSLQSGILVSEGNVYDSLGARRTRIRIKKTPNECRDPGFVEHFESHSETVVAILKTSDIISITLAFDDEDENQNIEVYWGSVDYDAGGIVRNPNQETFVEEETGDFCIGIGC